MAQPLTAQPAAVTEEEFYAARAQFLNVFTKVAFYHTIAIVVLLALMAIFLV